MRLILSGFKGQIPPREIVTLFAFNDSVLVGRWLRVKLRAAIDALIFIKFIFQALVFIPKWRVHRFDLFCPRFFPCLLFAESGLALHVPGMVKFCEFTPRPRFPATYQHGTHKRHHAQFWLPVFPIADPKIDPRLDILWVELDRFQVSIDGFGKVLLFLMILGDL